MSTSDSHCFPSRKGFPALAVRQLGLRPITTPFAFALRAHRGTAADQLALELGKATQVRQHQPPIQAWSCRPRCPAVI
jgi:hypothetical protein